MCCGIRSNNTYPTDPIYADFLCKGKGNSVKGGDENGAAFGLQNVIYDLLGGYVGAQVENLCACCEAHGFCDVFAVFVYISGSHDEAVSIQSPQDISCSLEILFLLYI